MPIDNVHQLPSTSERQRLVVQAARRIAEKFGPPGVDGTTHPSVLMQFLVDEGFEGAVAADALQQWRS